MKIQTIARTAETCARERKGDLPAMPRSASACAHPFERAREYVRAVNAAKLDRLFAKPFVCAMPDGHADGAYCLARAPGDVTVFASGSADGEVRVWDVGARRAIFARRDAHRFVRGVGLLDTRLTHSPGLLSAGDDGVVRLWRYGASGETAASTLSAAAAVYTCGGALSALDVHRDSQLFAAAGTGEVALWDVGRTDAPVQRFRWGSESVCAVRFSAAEPSLFATCGADRAVVLHDLRVGTPIARAVVRMRCNAAAFNPQDAPILAAACDDTHAYVFDIRRLGRPLLVHAGHAAAVTDVDYSPTGAELLTAGYDRTLRLWDARAPRSRDTYHTKRMQRVTAARWSLDASYVLCASDDGGVRVWKASASAQLGARSRRQTDATDYGAALVARFAAAPEVKRIAGRRRVPRAIMASAVGDARRREAEDRRRMNAVRSSKSGALRPGERLRPDPREGVVLSASVGTSLPPTRE